MRACVCCGVSNVATTIHHCLPLSQIREGEEAVDKLVLCQSCHRLLHESFSNGRLRHMEKRIQLMEVKRLKKVVE